MDAIETPKTPAAPPPRGGARWRTGRAGPAAWAWLATLARVVGGLVASASAAHAATLPEDHAEALFHSYDGGGVKANGPALLVRKSLADKVSLSGQVYVDAVSNASIDVVTTASPFKETRTAWELGATTVVRDSTLALSLSKSTEPDYVANAFGFDVSNEVFGGLTTVSLGFTRAHDQVGKKGVAGFIDTATHWQYRTGVTQILTPRWLVSLNAEAIADSGYLGSPYRAARIFGAAVPERNPRTRSSRAVKLRSINDTGAWWPGSAFRAEYRAYWDNWDIKSSTVELGGSKYVGERWLLDAMLRFYSQDKALFYSDNATRETLYLSRNRQLSTFDSTSFGATATYSWPARADGMAIKLIGSVERQQFRFKDFTDLRTGKPYAYDADVLQLTLSATF